MATVDDFAGRDCPFCGAVDSLEEDYSRGEVACVECAKVVGMGLEESVQTRYNEGAANGDVDYRSGQAEGSDQSRLLAQASGAGGLSRSAAAALASGMRVRGVAAAGGENDINTAAGREAKYKRTQLHPRMRAMIDNLTRISRRAVGILDGAGENPIKTRALAIARTFVGYRRDHGKKVEHQGEVSAACVQIAAEMGREPIPLAELRVLDPSLGNVDMVRRDIIADTKMEDTEKQLRADMAANLSVYYLRLMRVQLSRYEEPVAALLEALQLVTSAAMRGTDGRRKFIKNMELSQFVEAERVLAAVLLARTERTLQWEDKPLYDAGAELQPATAYASFAASAHLNAARVEKVMQIASASLPDIRAVFAEVMEKRRARAKAAATKTEDTVDTDAVDPGKATTTTTGAGLKRERSP